MNKIRKMITRILPEYGFLPVVCAFMFNSLVYGGAKLIAGDWYHHNIESSFTEAFRLFLRHWYL